MATDSVKIRMYRHGFGDCFLLRYFDGAKCTCSMLIDCGLKLNDSVDGITMEDVAADIATVLRAGKSKTVKPKLDILVVTHEHWDHVSGFHPDKALFDDLNIGKIWMGWTESPTDKEAIAIRKHINKQIKALKIAGKKLKNSPSAQPGFYQHMANGKKLEAATTHFNNAVEEVAAFFGPLGVDVGGGITLPEKFRISMDSFKAMDHVKSLAKNDAGIEYFYPGDLIELKNKLPGIRFYVLGPPKSKLLNKDKPSSGAKKEVYLGLRDTSLSGFVDGVLHMTGYETDHDESTPFVGVDVLTPQEASMPDKYAAYFNEDEYRTIEEDWLGITGALAIQVDSDTNNTSLALAIELVDSGKIMLFPGDAQVGSWLSWHELEWEVKNNGKKEKVNITSLLNNTILYKAGHHASHNATLKELGLELMSDDLVVLVPEKEKQYNGIPYASLITRMEEKSKGRVFFSADSNYPPTEVLKKKPAGLSKEEWTAFKKDIVIEDLFIEYTVRG